MRSGRARNRRDFLASDSRPLARDVGDPAFTPIVASSSLMGLAMFIAVAHDGNDGDGVLEREKTERRREDGIVNLVGVFSNFTLTVST